jgi:hypothetical protein
MGDMNLSSELEVGKFATNTKQWPSIPHTIEGYSVASFLEGIYRVNHENPKALFSGSY